MTPVWFDAKQLAGLLTFALLVSSPAQAANPWSASGDQGRYSGSQNQEQAVSGNPWADRPKAGAEAPRYAPADRRDRNRSPATLPSQRGAQPKARKWDRQQRSYRQDSGRYSEGGAQYGRPMRPYSGPIRRPAPGAYGPAGSVPYMPSAPRDGFGPLGTGGFQGPEEFWD